MSFIQNVKLSSLTTISDYEDMLREEDKEAIANFIFQRLSERYIIPLENVPISYKNGFSIMANSCLLIETYESFRQGWDSTSAKDRIPFKSFFERELLFKEFKVHSYEFYLNVRCGILHQGETKKGWKITRKANLPLLTIDDKRINANKFIRTLKEVLKLYSVSLKNADWNDDIWINCRDKIEFIIQNCKE